MGRGRWWWSARGRRVESEVEVSVERVVSVVERRVMVLGSMCRVGVWEGKEYERVKRMRKEGRGRGKR